ncbi:hypothetical protein ACIGMX_12425 [Streptomyces aquilus]|uniref:hypothetical protein n=1 Tax=Streptomyces aquilus TaxID=2548456 RepID=UPI0037D31753
MTKSTQTAPTERTPALIPSLDQVVPSAERQLAVRHWLLSALDETGRDRARMEWDSHGCAFFRLGMRFAAVRFHARLVHGVAGTETLQGSNAYLADALGGGPVICDPYAWHYYALVLPSAVDHLNYPETRGKWGIEPLGRNTFLGVPRVERLGPQDDHASYWAVPMPSAGELCEPDLVAQLLDEAVRRALAEPGPST